MTTEHVSKKVVLVTGGAGYIGSHACQALAAAGWLPVAYDNMSAGHEWAVQWGPLEVGDIADTNRVREIIQTYKPSAVMHFAGLLAVGESVVEPARYYENNVLGSFALLDAMRLEGVKNIVFSSTCAVYGEADVVPIAETSPYNPLSPYGASKQMVERMLEDYDRAYGVKFAALRYFNACGASPDARIGEAHDPETHLIPLVLDVAIGKRASIKVFGNDYPTPDGTCLRDYIHVCDLATAHVAALERMLNTQTSLALNLGTGSGLSVLEIIRTAEKVTGREIPVEIVERRPGDPAALYSDVRLSRELLPEWSPRFSTANDIIRDAWRWHQRLASANFPG
ncbi:UDP-glucose 4-epimerase GalE [Insolitispirillum peregrinum]|uniref:UDP-glucose 4-epimerase GalE n=1 Tax=Insolitispirillum peregrinum TaxID=80876 RepID=UPI0036156501